MTFRPFDRGWPLFISLPVVNAVMTAGVTAGYRWLTADDRWMTAGRPGMTGDDRGWPGMSARLSRMSNGCRPRWPLFSWQYRGLCPGMSGDDRGWPGMWPGMSAVYFASRGQRGQLTGDDRGWPRDDRGMLDRLEDVRVIFLWFRVMSALLALTPIANNAVIFATLRPLVNVVNNNIADRREK